MPMDRTNAERQRRYIARLKAKAAAQAGVSNAEVKTELTRLKDENARLKAELASLNAAAGRLSAATKEAWPRTTARIAELEAELARERNRSKMLEEGLKVAQRQVRATSQPKPAKPPLPPDEARERRIKALTTEVRNLKGAMHNLAARYNEDMATAGGMPFATQSAIAKCLHPDSRNHASVADKDKAFKGFTAWKADKDKAARKAKR
jgi:hypothetical protein